MHPEAARCVDPEGSCHQKWPKLIRLGSTRKGEECTEVQSPRYSSSQPPASAELFKDKDKSLESTELLKTSFWDGSKKYTSCFQVVSHKRWSIFG